MREIRLYGSEGGGAARSPYPYQFNSVANRNETLYQATNLKSRSFNCRFKG